jgi:hypothetical protein
MSGILSVLTGWGLLGAAPLIGEPPAVYFQDFPGRVIELRLSMDDVHDLCRKPNQRAAPLGCAFRFRDDLCVVVISASVREPQLGAMRRHENGHCNGWIHR